MHRKTKVIRTSTVAISLNYLLKGQLSYLNKHHEIIAVSGQDEHLDQVAAREKVKTIAVTMHRPVKPLQDLKSLWQLYRLFKKENPAIVHSITPKGGLLSMLAAKMAGVPVRIHTFTGLIFPSKEGYKQKTLILMDRLLCWCATAIFPEGEGVKNDLISFKITTKPLKVIANGNVNGIDTSHFHSTQIEDTQKELLRKELNIAPDDFVFIKVGRLVRDKGINELVEAFGQLTGKKAKLILVGPLEQELDPLFPETLAAIKLNPNIITTGFIPDVRAHFAIANALVFPSYREGFPNVVMQAGSMGLPAIVTNINGCNEIIKEGVNGLIIPIKDAQAIKLAMLKLLEDKELTKNLQKNSREMITSRFEQHLVWEALLKEYVKLLERV